MQREVWKRFFVFEGIDGVGKSTQAHLLAEALRSESTSFWITEEPTKTSPIGKLIRTYLEKKLPIQDLKTLAYLFAADRAEHVAQIKSHIAAGELVLCDRYFFSSLAYQSQDLGFETIAQLNKNFPLPEIIFFLSLDPKSAVERREIFPRGDDLFDKALSRQTKAQKLYQTALAELQDLTKVIYLDASRPMEELHALIKSSIK